jgi:hypothetical protein
MNSTNPSHIHSADSVSRDASNPFWPLHPYPSNATILLYSTRLAGYHNPIAMLVYSMTWHLLDG